MEWTDSGKARISDLFRRIDKSGTGRVPRAAFIDGIITSSESFFIHLFHTYSLLLKSLKVTKNSSSILEFQTTRLEMEKVADEFDKGDGMIDSKEFMAKLRSEFSKVHFYCIFNQTIICLVLLKGYGHTDLLPF